MKNRRKVIRRNKTIPVHIDILFLTQSLPAVLTPLEKMLSLH